MSYCKLIIFKNGIPSDGIEFRDSWGGAARIWNSLFDAHVPKTGEFDSWMTNPTRLWNIASMNGVSLCEKAVHVFTFDKFYVEQKNFKCFASDLRQFVKMYPVPERVDHLPEWAMWFDENVEVEAVGLYATSVSENLWYRHKHCEHCDSETDEREPVPLTEGKEVYAWLASQSNIKPETKETEILPESVGSAKE